ncbi:GMC family oxidoreductase [Falsiroseomonas sp.]|uniref:GMC family oxidoreductase n=1 Tax=Falsiroseomonas sp. TaxID=2870721 RepID=UPI00356AA0FC
MLRDGARPGRGRARDLLSRKVLGGSSAINGHLWVRGQARDFDGWAQRGCLGWSHADALPYFRRAEDRSTGADAWRGAGGPQHVSDIHARHPICEAFLAGAAELGLPRNPDYNGASQEGLFYYQRSIRAGRRMSAARSYLHPALRRPNLRVETHAHALRLEVEGRRVTGVLFRQHGRLRRAPALREVLLAAGAIGSPHLLQLSGIGDAAHLQGIGVPVLHHLPGVGDGLQDHYGPTPFEWTPQIG